MGMGTGPHQILADTSTLLQTVLMGSVNGSVTEGRKTQQQSLQKMVIPMLHNSGASIAT